MIVAKPWEGGGEKGIHFWCPGCNTSHTIRHEPTGWQWNGDLAKPTLSPSVLVTSGHHIHGRQRETCWCTLAAVAEHEGKEPPSFKCGRCHSFVTDGRIQFLDDCTHELKGQTVDLPPWPHGEAS